MRRIAAALALTAVLLPGPAPAQSNWPNLPANSVIGRFGIGTGPAQAIPFSVLASRLTPAPIPVTGADATGVVDATSIIQGAVNAAGVVTGTQGGATVTLPCGLYRVSSTITMSTGGVSLQAPIAGCVQLRRYTDYGPTIQISNASGVIAHLGLKNLTIYDLAAANGTAGYSTCATSPYHIVVDGVNDFVMENVTVAYGCGLLALKGVINGFIRNPNLQTFAIPGVPSQNALGTGLYIGFSTNSNLTTKYSANIWVTNLELEGGANGAGNSKLSDGVRIDGADGVWMSNPHVQNTSNADYRISHSGSYTMANIYLSNMMADIALGNGVLFDGSVQVIRSKIEGVVSAADLGAANKHGTLITGTGGVNGLELNLSIDGWGGSGLYVDASNVSNLTIRPKIIRDNNVSVSTFNSVDIRTGTNVDIIGGIIDGSSHAVAGLNIGASVARWSLTGAIVSTHTAYGAVVASGSTKGVISGGSLDGNTSGPLSNSATAGNLVVAGVGGLLGQITGTSTNDSASAGNIGELVSNTAAANSVSLTTATAKTVTSVSLTQGDWDCRGVVSRTLAASTSVTELVQSISQTNNTLSGSLVDGSSTAWDTAANVMVGATTLPVGPFQVQLASTTTVYLVAKDTFSVSTDVAGGTLSCRRAR